MMGTKAPKEKIIDEIDTIYKLSNSPKKSWVILYWML